MKRYFNLLLMFALVLGLCACGGKVSGASTWQEQYDLGVKYLSEGNYEEAVIAFTAAIDIDPKQSAAYVGRGDGYTGMAEILDAEQEWDKVLEQYGEAERDYLQAIELDSVLVAVYHKLADVYLAMGDPQRAVEILELGYQNTQDEGLRERAESSRTLPLDLPTGSTVVSMFDVDGTFLGHDAYSFDAQGRMTSNIWYGTENEVICSETWDYNDEADTTTIVRRDQQESGEYEIVEETVDGCDDLGWYWADMDDFVTDPTLEAEDGVVQWGESYAVYGYDTRGRVNSIHTYDSADVLLGYCTVSYAN